ncbi:hypothetical protein EV702DRAFT_1046918 [Suillus placidus]|uniref:Uncharacterized protein n=1 Tax=Suillus placidus TaxID=48579 RepID=A0A9P6ZR81_9AGAM|nr:hypothetical protein EV702DRAFT_1046918 [Suillus placidus]
MGPPASIGNNLTPGPSVIVEDISTMGPWSAGPYHTGYYALNLNETCHTACHISTYEDWPVYLAATNYADLVTRFELRRLSSPLRHAEIVPYFADYLGAHWSIYPPQTWSRMVSAIPGHINSSRRRHHAVFPTARDQLLGHVQHPVQHVEPDALVVVPPKHTPNLPMVQEGPILSPNQQDHLYTLAAGRGIDEFDADGLLEKCDGCRRVFIPTTLRLHIIGGCGER